MTNLIQYAEQQFQNEITISSDGVGRATVRGTARLAGIADSSLITGFQGAVLEPSKLATFLIGQGFEGAVLETFSANGIPDIAIASIVEYYAFEAGRYCTDKAKHVYRAFARMGIRIWMQNLTGWQQPNVTADQFMALQSEVDNLSKAMLAMQAQQMKRKYNTKAKIEPAPITAPIKVTPADALRVDSVKVQDWLAANADEFKLVDFVSGVVGKDNAFIRKTAGTLLKELGYTAKQVRRDGERVYIWFAPYSIPL